MPIVYINGKFCAQPMTGVQRYAYNLVLALDALPLAEPRCVLLCPPGAAQPALRSVEVRAVGPSGLPLHLWEQLVLPWAARRGLLLNLAGSAPLFASRQWCTFHDAAVFDHPASYTRAFVAWYRLHFRWLARHAERLLTVSAHSRARLALQLGMAPTAIGIVPNGGDHFAVVEADTRVLSTLGLTDRCFVLAVGSDNPTKNLAALVRAWQELQADPSLRLVIVGDSDPAVFAAAAGTACAAVKVAGVLRAGRVGDGELKALYGAALGLVFPSLDEGFGLPPLEALSLGCPVAAARVGAVPEVCGDAVLYFDPHSVPAITAALRELIADAGLRQRLAASGRKRAADWTWQQSALSLTRLLTPCAGRPA